MNGWWRFHRSMYDHPVWSLSDGQRIVWITILGYANHKENEWWNGSERVVIPAGSLITSLEHLARDAKVGKQVVRGAIQSLLKIGSISTQIKTQRYTMITVINWKFYSGTDEEDNTVINTEATQSQHSPNTAATLTGEGKKEKKNTLGDFDTFWAAYPRKLGKDQARKAWMTLHPQDGLFEAILLSLEAHKKTLEWLKDGGQFIPYPATWLRGKRWEDELQLSSSPQAPEYDPASDPHSDWPISWMCEACGEVHETPQRDRGTCQRVQSRSQASIPLSLVRTKTAPGSTIGFVDGTQDGVSQQKAT